MALDEILLPFIKSHNSHSFICILFFSLYPNPEKCFSRDEGALEVRITNNQLNESGERQVAMGKM